MVAEWLASWRRSLALKVFLPTLLLTALAILAGSFFLQSSINKDLKAELQAHSSGVVQTLLYGVENLSRLDELERFLCVAGADRDVKGVWLVCGSPGRVAATNQLQDRGLTQEALFQRWPELDGVQLGERGWQVQEGLLVSSHTQLSRSLIKAGLASPASLVVMLDEGPMNQYLGRITRHFAHYRVLLLLSLLLGLVGVIQLAVLRPLARLSREVQHARHEAEARRIHEGSGDEIGRLARVVKQALLDLYAERSRFELVAERNPALIYRCRNDANWTMEYMSSAVEDLTGHPARDFIGNTALDYESAILPEDRELVRVGVEEGLAGDRSWDIEYRVVHVDGSVRPVREQGLGHLDSRTGDWILDGIILDLSATQRQREMERQLAEAERVRQDGLRPWRAAWPTM